jgi:hypothetical protein
LNLHKIEDQRIKTIALTQKIRRRCTYADNELKRMKEPN